MNRTRIRQHLVRVVAIAVVVALPGWPVAPRRAGAAVGFGDFAAGFGTGTTIYARVDHIGPPLGAEDVTVGHRDSGGDEVFAAHDGGRAVIDEVEASASASADARSGSLSGSASAHWRTSPGTGVTYFSTGQTRSVLYHTCRVLSDVHPTGTLVSSIAPLALPGDGKPFGLSAKWTLSGPPPHKFAFSEQTPGLNAGDGTFTVALMRPDFVLVLPEGYQTATSSQAKRVDRAGVANLTPALVAAAFRIGDRFVIQSDLSVTSRSLEGYAGEAGTFTSAFVASTVPVVEPELRDLGVRMDCTGLSQGKQEFAAWEMEHCPPFVPVSVPKQDLTVAFLPARLKDSTSSLTFDQVVERVDYIKDFYYQQSGCSVVIHPWVVRDVDSADGWLELPRTLAEYDTAGVAGTSNWPGQLLPLSKIWVDAFEQAALNDPAFLNRQQAPPPLEGFDTVFVIQTVPTESLRGRAYITKPIADRLELPGGADLAAYVAAFIEGFPLTGLENTIFSQGSVSISDTEPTSIWAHELGHSLFNFWDYYGNVEPFGHGMVGTWGLMGQRTFAPPPPAITYDRTLRGWLDAQVIPPDGFGDYPLTPLGEMSYGDQALIYQAPPGANDAFYFELRNPTDHAPLAPEHTRIQGRWDAVTRTPTSIPDPAWRTILVDASPNAAPFGIPNSLQGRFLRPDASNAAVVVRIVENTSTTVTVDGDLPAGVTFGDSYEVLAEEIDRSGAPCGLDIRDDDGDGAINDGCPAANGQSEGDDPASCVPGTVIDEDGTVIDEDEDGVVNDGCPPVGVAESESVTGVVVYAANHLQLPTCGSFANEALAYIMDPFGTDGWSNCLSKVDNRADPVCGNDEACRLDSFTLRPGGPAYVDDPAGVAFSLSDDLVLSIRDAPGARTVVELAVDAFDVTAPGLPSSMPVGSELQLPLDLHVRDRDGKHVGRVSPAEYELQIDGARAGGVNAGPQWISLPDSIPASYIVDASRAVANARAAGIETLAIDATVSVVQYDAAGVPTSSGPPVRFTLTSDQPALAPVAIGPADPSDTIPPSTSAAATPAPGEAGWNTTDVAVTLSATDDGDSGPKTITYSAAGAQPFPTTTSATNPTTFTVTAEGSTTVTYYATDHAGNQEAPKTLTVKIDKTAPSATLVVTAGTPGDDGWYTSDVTIATTGTDAVSSPVTCTPDQLLTTETAGAVYNGSCTNGAGLSTDGTPLAVKLDNTAPTTATTPSPPPNAAGWNTGAVSVTVSCTDDPSGCARTAVNLDGAGWTPYAGAPNLTDEGVHELSYRSTDEAGNQEATKRLTVKIDQTPPAVSCQAPPPIFPLGAVGMTVAASVSDTLSGPIAATLTGAADTSSLGTKSASLTGADTAGNATTVNCGYTVGGDARQELSRLVNSVVGSSQISAAKKAVLITKLQALVATFNPAKLVHRLAVCAGLAVFKAAVQREAGRTIPLALATQWIADASRIRAMLGC